MPLRDHFHKPALEKFHWEGFHSAWANTIVRQLNTQWLPERYRAEPQIHLGSEVEVDVAALDEEPFAGAASASEHGTATAVWAPPEPTLTLETDFDDPDIFEVRVYDDERQARLVGAVEFVSPGNKDRESARRDFVLKCGSYLRAGVALVIVDIVTSRRGNLVVELMHLMKSTDAAHDWIGRDLYAVALRPGHPQKRWNVSVWPHELQIGAPLPQLPLWLSESFVVPLDLEASYEETCGVLRVGKAKSLQ
jgi:hypothetical protein